MYADYIIEPEKKELVDILQSYLSNPEKLKKLSQTVIQRVEVFLDKRMWRIVLNQEIDSELESEITGIFRQIAGQEVNVQFYYENLELLAVAPDEFLAKIWPEIMAVVQAEIPVAAAWLANTTPVLEDDKLRIEVENQFGLEVLQRKKCVDLLEHILAERFKRKIKVILEIGDFSSVQSEIEQRYAEKEKELIAQIINTETKEKKADTKKSEDDILYGKKITGEITELREIVDEQRQVIVQGQVFAYESRETRSGNLMVTFSITDLTDSITIKVFEKEERKLDSALSKGMWIKAKGNVQYDKYSQELNMMADSINRAEAPKGRTDEAPEKRIELHLHTKMSSMDAIVDVGEAIKKAAEWGHPAIAITDHGVAQAFPEAYQAAKKHGIKVLYGLEGYLVNDTTPLIENPGDKNIEDTVFTVLDLETTGFDAFHNEIIEIGAVKVYRGEIIEEFNELIKPEASIPAKITELTGISNGMVQDAASLEEVLPKFKVFMGDSVLVAHNAPFDIGFLRAKFAKLQMGEIKNPIIDTIGLARCFYPERKTYKLSALAKDLGIKLEQHHRAFADVYATAKLFEKMAEKFAQKEIITQIDINDKLVSNVDIERQKYFHVILMVKNYYGLRNLYKLVSYSHLNHFFKVPRIPRSLLMKHRQGLIVGSACEAGELFQAYLNNYPDDKIREIGKFYDFFEIQPTGNNEFLLRDGKVKSEAELRQFNRNIYMLGKKMGKPVVATGDVHFLNPEDEVYRRILMAGQGFSDADNQAPLYLRTTEEMLAEFSYLGEQEARDVVIDAPKIIADQIDDIKPIPDGLYAPKIEGAEEIIQEMSYTRARELYGDPLPEIVQKRLEKEIKGILASGYTVVYMISHKLVKKSLDDGYLVGSRGSVGSSFVATMSNITEVNPLPPHYLCLDCKHSEFVNDERYASGVDLPDKDCPRCGKKYKKEGHDIPFEVFMGFEGNKEPDIDLNFSGEYQPIVHKYTEELFGSDHVFRAGTIATIADKTAYGFVKGYITDKKLRLRDAEINRLSQGCAGVKRTSGQHPGGLMLVPQDREVFEFTPIQYPANDKNSGVRTTHFDYHSISGRLLKIDILGHDDPTVIRMLQDLLDIDPKTIPIDDPVTMGIFSSTEPLKVTPEQICANTGTYGIPEFGTKFVRQMLEDTKPSTFAELVRISGLSHGTDVWLNNAQDLIRQGKAKLAEVISVRDDIMNYLSQRGLPPVKAFEIMESVRKGKGLKPEMEQLMKENNIPDWYIESCKKIKYMFPKAHAVAYVMMAYRIAYCKVHYPLEFYATYFSVRADEFDVKTATMAPDALRRFISDIEQKGNDATTKEKNVQTILELSLEMQERGFGFLKVDLYESDAKKFIIKDGKLLPPLGALGGLGVTAAQNIVEARAKEEFTSIEDLRVRAKVNKNVVEILQQNGCLDGLPEHDQLSLFS